MKLHPMDIVLWAVACFAEAILAYAILKKGAARRWPFLLSLLFFDLLHSVIAAAALGNYHSFFNIYWYGHALRSLLALGLLYDVFRSLPALKYVPKQMGLVLVSAGATVTIGSVLLTSQHHAPAYAALVAEALIIRECVTVLWVGCALSLLGSVSFFGLGWTPESVNVTAGFLASGVAAMLTAYLTSLWPLNYGHLFDRIQACIDIAVFLSWIKIFSGPLLPEPTLNPFIDHP
jgi:hypothetical protein